MPGRPSTRTPTLSRPPSKSSLQTLHNSRQSTASTTTAFPDEGPITSLRSQISTVFSNAQRSTAGHRKLVVGLRKLQDHCINEQPFLGGHEEQEGDRFVEDDFNVEFTRCVVRLMGVKKSENVGDNLVRFIGFYLRYSSEKGKENLHLRLANCRKADSSQMQRWCPRQSSKIPSPFLRLRHHV